MRWKWIFLLGSSMSFGLLGSVGALEGERTRVWVLPEAGSFDWHVEKGGAGVAEAPIQVGISPLLDPGMEWSELVLSWNVRPPIPDLIRFQVLPEVCGGQPVYDMGVWSRLPGFRRSVNEQEDQWGEVKTDVLCLKESGQRFRLKLVVSNEGEWRGEGIRFLGVTLSDRSSRGEIGETAGGVGTEGGGGRKNGAVVGLDVPTLSQMDYEGGEAWCSPTSVTMLLNYWASRLARSDLGVSVPWTAAQVHDPEWPGTGNWPFNVAVAGGFEGMRGVVARLKDLSEVQEWIESGVPLALSVSNNRLKGRPYGGSGHLVVCVGFTEGGDVIINDPGTRFEKRKTIPRAVMQVAWEESNRTVYLIYPEIRACPNGFFRELRP